MKALFFDDGMFSREAILAPANRRKLAGLEEIEMMFVKDTNPAAFSAPAEFVGKLERQGPEGWIVPPPGAKDLLKKADILFIHMSGVTAEIMDMAPHLKLIFCFRSGTDGINLKAARERGITVCNCPSRLAEPVADLAIALMIAECRGLVRCELHTTQGAWHPDDIKDASNAALSNLTIGLYGYGGIARKVARRLVHGFCSRVIAYDPFTPPSVMEGDGVEPMTEEILLAEADIVSLHVKLTEETKGIFGKKQFDQMKPTAIFINTARGELVKEDDLVDALRNGSIRSAGLDVYASEPIDPDHPLLQLPNVTATPHMAGVTMDIVPNTLSIMAEEMRRFLHDEPLKFTVK